MPRMLTDFICIVGRFEVSDEKKHSVSEVRAKQRSWRCPPSCFAGALCQAQAAYEAS